MYIITGATGNTGHRIAEALLKAGKPVTAIGRSAEKLSALVAQGAIAAVGDLEDSAFLTQTFRGATAVYALIPPHFATDDFRAYQGRVADAFVTALRANQVPNIVTLSSMGSHLPENNGVLNGLYYFEQQLNAIEGLNALHLRAGYFMENFFSSVGMVDMVNGLAGFPIKGDIPMAMAHTQDIATKAFQHLLALDFEGKLVEMVAGPRDYTLNEAASILGAAIGKPDLAWIFFPYDQARAAMIQNGLNPNLADLYIEFCQLANAGGLNEGFERNASNTTPTTLESFAVDFANAYRAQAVKA